jgi:hypothetical protein
MIPAMNPRALLIPALATAALAAPAASASASDTYNVAVAGDLTLARHASNGSYWGASTNIRTHVNQVIRGVTVEDRKFPVVKAADATSFTATKLTATIDEQTDAGNLHWDCRNTGEAYGAPGAVSLDVQGESAHMIVSAAKWASLNELCQGYSTGSQETDITIAPLQADVRFPVSQLQGGSGAIHLNLPCPLSTWTISCAARFDGAWAVTRTGGDGSDTVESKPAPKPQPAKPVKPIKQVGGRVTANGKAAKVTLRCATACQGKVSATAVAKGKQPAKPLGAKSFATTQARPKTVTVEFGSRSRIAHTRGAVILNVRAQAVGGGAAQTRTIRVRVPR